MTKKNESKVIAWRPSQSKFYFDAVLFVGSLNKQRLELQPRYFNFIDFSRSIVVPTLVQVGVEKKICRKNHLRGLALALRPRLVYNPKDVRQQIQTDSTLEQGQRQH